VSDDRMHRAASADGTEIADRVRGTGRRWTLTTGLRGATKRPWSLSASGGSWVAQHNSFWSDGSPSRINDWEHTIDATLDPGRDAHALLSQLYEIFGLDYTDVGFSEGGQVDLQRIRNLASQ
jgi:hypothetical protein